MRDKIKKIVQFAYSRKTIVENFSYLSLLQIVLLLAPLVTYPYLVGKLGMNLYGVIVSAQMLTGYAGILIDCGTNAVCAKHVSINRDNKEKLAEIVNSVLAIRIIMAIMCFFIYMLVAYFVPAYHDYFFLFLISYGMVMQEVLFPQYFFQGVEKLLYPAVLSIVIKIIFIIAIFIFIQSPSDYIYVPLLYMLGYTISSAAGLYLVVVKMGVRLMIPQWEQIKIYLKDSSSIFATDVVCTIKDKFNYFFIGSSIGMAEVTIYDLGIKLNSLVSKPVSIMQTVMFPRMAKSRSLISVKRLILVSFTSAVVMCLFLNIFLPWIVEFFLHKKVDLFPIRILSLAPVILSVSGVLCTNFMVAFGYNKYVFYSIVFTTIAYIAMLILVLIVGLDNSLYSFVYIAIATYCVELVYRMYATKKIILK